MMNYFIEESSLPMINYRIIPDYSVSNTNNIAIAQAFANMYETPRERLSIRQGTFHKPKIAEFNILLKENHASFYLGVNREYNSLVHGKMKTVWNKSEIREENEFELLNFNIDKTEICELVLKDYNFKSLDTNRGNLYPLTNMLGVVRDLKEHERLRVLIHIEPMKRANWATAANDELKNYKKGKLVNNEMSTKEKMFKLGFMGVEAGLNLWIDYKMLLFESIFGIIMPEKKEEEPIHIKIDSLESVQKENQLIGLTNDTFYKLTSHAFKTRIIILSESEDDKRAKLNMLAVANSYKDLTGNNELVIKLLSRREQENMFKNVMGGNIIGNDKCILSDKEVSKLIQLPQKDLQEQYKIDSIDTREVDIPEELQNGTVRIGIAVKQGKRIVTYWSTDKNIMALAKVFVGPQNAGKTTALKRTVKDCHNAKYSNIVIDFIENCETAREVSEVIKDNEKVIIELGKKDFIPALAYNEVSRLIKEDMDSWERVRLANLLAEQVEYLINAITDTSTGELSAPMLRYLHSACMVSFIKPDAKINDAFEILRRWDKRSEAIRYAKDTNCFDRDDEIFFNLEEIHKRDKDGKIIGTREDLIVGITNRISTLKKNPYLKAMLQADIDDSQDFAKYIEEGKSIFIMIPQNLFPNIMIRDILTTFFISRIWLTVQMRENNKDARLCNVVFDEVHQVPTTARFLSNHITEFRRHRLGLILSCHYLKQFRDLLTALKSSGASYIFIAGTEKENLEALKEELQPYTVEDGLNLKKHTSLNIVNYGNEYATFITSLPNK